MIGRMAAEACEASPTARVVPLPRSMMRSTCTGCDSTRWASAGPFPSPLPLPSNSGEQSRRRLVAARRWFSASCTSCEHLAPRPLRAPERPSPGWAATPVVFCWLSRIARRSDSSSSRARRRLSAARSASAAKLSGRSSAAIASEASDRRRRPALPGDRSENERLVDGRDQDDHAERGDVEDPQPRGRLGKSVALGLLFHAKVVKLGEFVRRTVVDGRAKVHMNPA